MGIVNRQEQISLQHQGLRRLQSRWGHSQVSMNFSTIHQAFIISTYLFLDRLIVGLSPPNQVEYFNIVYNEESRPN